MKRVSTVLAIGFVMLAAWALWPVATEDLTRPGSQTPTVAELTEPQKVAVASAVGPGSERHAIQVGEVQLVGRVVASDGLPAVARVRLLAAGTPIGEEAVSAADGRFAIQAAANVSRPSVRARSDSGGVGEVSVELRAGDSVVTVPDIVLHRGFEATLQLHVDQAAYEIARSRPGAIRVTLARVPRVSFVAPPEIQLAAFDFRDGPHQEKAVRVECVHENKLRWWFELEGGQRFLVHEDDVSTPPLLREYACDVTSKMFLQGRCTFTGGAPLSYAPCLVEVKSPIPHEAWLSTDSNGEFFVVTMSQSAGTLRTKWCKSSVEWMVPSYQLLTCEAQSLIKVRVRTNTGEAVPCFALTSRNMPIRDRDGLPPPPPCVLHSKDGTLTSDWSTLAAGARVIVHVPSKGEFAHVLAREWRASDGILDIVLDRAADGAIRFSRSPSSNHTGNIVNVHLVGSGAAAGYEYRFMIPRASTEPWTAKRIFPGSYDGNVAHSGMVVTSSLSVASGETTDVPY